jgi:hypothetical protein
MQTGRTVFFHPRAALLLRVKDASHLTIVGTLHMEEPEHVFAIAIGHFKRDANRFRKVNSLAQPGDAVARLDDGNEAILAPLQLNLKPLHNAMTVKEDRVPLETAAMVELLSEKVRGREAQALVRIEPAEDWIRLLHDVPSSNSMVKVTWAGRSLLTI